MTYITPSIISFSEDELIDFEALAGTTIIATTIICPRK